MSENNYGGDQIQILKGLEAVQMCIRDRSYPAHDIHCLSEVNILSSFLSIYSSIRI